jgi:SAM-dependent MidA family methyltransferase
LQALQKRRFEALDVPTLWHGAFKDIPAGPIIVIANEFVDALPVHQAVKQADGWHERVVEIGADGNLRFGLARDTLLHFETGLPRVLRQSPEGSIFEWRSDRFALELGRRVRADGAALIIDYGHIRCGLGDTLQAVAGHAYTDPLRAPGEADLTAHVDFEALAQSAESIGGYIHGPIPQREFLFRLGIDKRAAVLKAGAGRDKVLEIDMALSRLTASGAQGMLSYSRPSPSPTRSSARFPDLKHEDRSAHARTRQYPPRLLHARRRRFRRPLCQPQRRRRLEG